MQNKLKYFVCILLLISFFGYNLIQVVNPKIVAAETQELTSEITIELFRGIEPLTTQNPAIGAMTYFVITNKSANIVRLTFDIKYYDKDGAYVGGGKWPTIHVPPHCLIPKSTMVFESTNWKWSAYKISNIQTEILQNPFKFGDLNPSTIQIYENIRFIGSPEIVNNKNADPKWNIEKPAEVADEKKWYIVGEIENTGNITPHNVRFDIVFRYNGKIVAVKQPSNNYSPGVKIPPPGEKIKCRFDFVRPLTDIYNSYNIQIISWSSAGLVGKLPEPVQNNSDQKTNSRDKQPTSGSSGCFIATAAYGTPTAKEIDILRQFRDLFLNNSNLGRELVRFYYSTSPPIAEYIARHEVVRVIVREAIVDPIVTLIHATKELWR